MTENLLATWSGRRLIGARRIRYVHPDGALSADGPLELSFDGSHTYLLDAGSDGETLRVLDGPWQDPFAPPLSAENIEFLEISGRWAAFDLTRQAPWEALLKSTIGAQSLKSGPESKLIGATLWAGPVVVDIQVDCDELVITLRP